MTRRGRGSSSGGSSAHRVVEVVGGARVRGGRPCFLGLPLPCPELDPYPAINDLYNICIN